MATRTTYDIVFVEGLKPSTNRGVVLLSCEGDDEVDAVPTFAALDDKSVRELKQRFETWMDGVNHQNRWFHGFTQHDYRDCFVFKWKKKNLGHRLYGFLCHPLPRTNQRYWLCVLTNHARKPLAQWETDVSELNKANGLRANDFVRAAIRMRFPDEKPGAKKWEN